MVRGLFTATSGMVAQQHRLNALSNNLANVDTNAYKRDTSVHKAFPEMLIRRFNDDVIVRFPIGSVDTTPMVGKLGVGVEYNESYTVFEQGSLKETNNPFDIALDGDGFFTIQTPQGERYTRNGSFILGQEGYLLTKEGYPVMGEEGPIQIKLNNFMIDPQGRIFQNGDLSENPQRLVSMKENDWANTELVDTLKIVRFENEGNRYIKKQGNSFWTATEESMEPYTTDLDSRPRVLSGFLETSNVNPVREMVNMIEVNRAYEANQRIVQAHDGLLEKLINQVTRY